MVNAFSMRDLFPRLFFCFSPEFLLVMNFPTFVESKQVISAMIRSIPFDLFLAGAALE
jgi:hypothetical protein